MSNRPDETVQSSLTETIETTAAQNTSLKQSTVSSISTDPQNNFLSLSSDEWQLVAFVIIVKVLLLWHSVVSYEVHLDKWFDSSLQVLQRWSVWDGGQYIDIVTRGYGSTGDSRLSLAFFPLYPWIARLLTHVVGNPMIGALLVSNIASLVLAVLLFRLVKLDYDSDIARNSVWFLFIFPTSYFLHAAYTESLFLAFVVASFLSARHGRWLVAGILGALATLTHDTGLLLAIALGIEVVHQFWTTREWQYRWLWLVLVPLGFAVFLLLNYRTTGQPFSFMMVESEHWTNHLTNPLAFRNQLGVYSYMSPANAAMIGTQVFCYVLLGLVATVASLWYLRPAYTVWMLSNWLIIAGQTWDLSAPRLILAMFPMFILAALVSRNRLCFAAISVWSVLFLAFFSSEYVMGHWAF